MAGKGRRPRLLNTAYLQRRLELQGRSEGDVAALVSEMQLVVPLLIRKLSKEEILKLIGPYADEFKLQPDYGFARGAIEHLKQWSAEELDRYRKERLVEGHP